MGRKIATHDYPRIVQCYRSITSSATILHQVMGRRIAVRGYRKIASFGLRKIEALDLRRSIAARVDYRKIAAQGCLDNMVSLGITSCTENTGNTGDNMNEKKCRAIF